MPNRIIKESIRTSYEINALSEQAEVTFYRLLTFADDYGRFPSDPRVLQASLFPLRPDIRSKDFTRWVAELVSADLIQLYISEDGKPFGFFVKWDKHQNKRAKSSKYPDPVGQTYPSIENQMTAIEDKKKHVIADDIICKQMQSDVPVLDTRTRISILDTRTRETSEKFSDGDPAYELSKYLLGRVIEHQPTHQFAKKPPNLQTWSEEADRMHRIDQRDWREAANVLKWVFDHSIPDGDFDWRDNVQSPAKLRKHYDRLASQIKKAHNYANGRKQTRGDRAAEMVRNTF